MLSGGGGGGGRDKENPPTNFVYVGGNRFRGHHHHNKAWPGPPTQLLSKKENNNNKNRDMYSTWCPGLGKIDGRGVEEEEQEELCHSFGKACEAGANSFVTTDNLPPLSLNGHSGNGYGRLCDVRCR